MAVRSPGPGHRIGRMDPRISAFTNRERMQATRPRSSGFRRCQAPHCRVSRFKVVWPSEYRMAVPVWGRVHLACRPSPYQLRMLRMTMAVRRLTVTFQVNVEPMRRAIAGIQQAMAGLSPQDVPPGLANPGRIKQPHQPTDGA